MVECMLTARLDVALREIISVYISGGLHLHVGDTLILLAPSRSCLATTEYVLPLRLGLHTIPESVILLDPTLAGQQKKIVSWWYFSFYATAGVGMLDKHMSVMADGQI